MVQGDAPTPTLCWMSTSRASRAAGGPAQAGVDYDCNNDCVNSYIHVKFIRSDRQADIAVGCVIGWNVAIKVAVEQYCSGSRCILVSN
jgi:hypothetical protein